MRRSHADIAEIINTAAQSRDNPEEVQQIQRLEAEVEKLKHNTRKKLLDNIDNKQSDLEDLKVGHEQEMEPLTKEIDQLQFALDEAVQKRLRMITRQVNEVKSLETEIHLARKQLHTFDRCYNTSESASLGGVGKNIFEKDFECPVCYEVMSPPSRIFQCNNGHLICEDCKAHSEVNKIENYSLFGLYFFIDEDMSYM